MATGCKKVKRGKRTWYCCQGRIAKGPHKGRPGICCAPMVGKNKVNAGATVCFYEGKDGKLHRNGGRRRKR